MGILRHGPAQKKVTGNFIFSNKTRRESRSNRQQRQLMKVPTKENEVRKLVEKPSVLDNSYSSQLSQR